MSKCGCLILRVSQLMRRRKLSRRGTKVGYDAMLGALFFSLLTLLSRQLHLSVKCILCFCSTTPQIYFIFWMQFRAMATLKLGVRKSFGGIPSLGEIIHRIWVQHVWARRFCFFGQVVLLMLNVSLRGASVISLSIIFLKMFALGT